MNPQEAADVLRRARGKDFVEFEALALGAQALEVLPAILKASNALCKWLLSPEKEVDEKGMELSKALIIALSKAHPLSAEVSQEEVLK